MTDTAQTQKKVRPITGRHVLIAIVAFFTLIIGVNIVFITLATGSFTGEDVPKAYLQGIDYNRTLEARAVQESQGWTAALEAMRDESGTVTVTLDLKNKAGAPLDGIDLTGTLRRPTQAALDQPLSFTASGDGQYTAQVTQAEPGAWEVIVVTGKDAPPFEARSRVWLP